MRDNEIVGLWEAYLQVHQPKEEVEQLDESGLSQDTIRSAVRKRQKRVDADYRENTPEGDERGDKGMKKLARSKRQLDINKPREVRMRANEEVENWVNSLIDEGYDLSEYTWEDMYEIYVTEGRYTSLSALSAESEKRKADKKRGRPETEAEIHGRLALGDFRPGASREERARGGRQRLRDRGKVPQKGGKDMFEHVLEHLVAEGYADTNESALVIMANMSEEWREDIFAEAITSKKGKAKAAEMIAARTTASGRAKPGKGANVAQIGKILRSDREGLGGTPMTPTMAKNPVKKKNYFGSGNRAARRAGTYQEQFELWINSLVEEGYDLSDYTWNEMYEFYLDEEERPFPEEKEDKDKNQSKTGLRGDETKKKPKGWRPTGPKRRYGERPGYMR